MIIDFEKYMPYLDEFDLSQDQKLALIRTVWGIMESQADQVFGFHPVQQVCCNADVKNLHSLKQNADANANVTTVSTHFSTATREAMNDNEYEQEKWAD